MGAAASAIGAGVSIVGGILGNGAASGSRQDANNSAAQALAALQQIGLPPDLSKAIVYQQFQSSGNMTPELEQFISTGPSQVANIKEDPATRDAQMAGLKLLQDRAQGGLTSSDRATINQERTQMGADQQAKQQQIIQGAQARGMGSSGAALMAQLQSAQSGANQASAAGDRTAALASQNALAAAGQSGTLGGQIRGQDFSVNQAKASAADEFNRFNVQNQQAVNQRNTAAGNQSQYYNLMNNQNISNQNTNLNNNELLRQANAKEKYWQDLLTQATGQSNAYRQDAAYDNAKGDRIAGEITGAANGVSALLPSFSSFMGGASGASGATSQIPTKNTPVAN